MFIPKGNYLTVDQYRLKLGGVTRLTVLKAIKQNRLKGAIQIDSKMYLIPEDAILFSKSIKTGKNIGVSAWIRGEIEHQEEVKNWEMKQAQLRKMREGDLKDDSRDEELDDYN